MNWLKEKKDHFEIFSKLIQPLQKSNIGTILDCGSGKTSLGLIKYHFPKAKDVDAIVYPGDQRKIDSVHDKFPKFNVIEKDIVRQSIGKSYDLIVGHLLFGESLKFGNRLQNMVESFFNIRSRFYLVIDLLEDTIVNFNYIKSYASGKNLSLVREIQVPIKEKYLSFRNYYGILLCRQ